MDRADHDSGEGLDMAREREAALREILQVISRSRDDATPVFEILLKTAQRLCQASNGAIVLGEEGGGPQILAAQTGASKETLERYRSGGFPMDPDESLAARVIVERRTLHFEDIEKAAPYREGMAAARTLVENEGIRSSIFVPLISNGKSIGCLNLLHRQQRSYSEDDIALVETFAAQAVIAIENVRQFRELQTRLEREAASAEILKVISESREDEKPVFDVILKSAQRLCKAPMAMLSLVDEERTQVRVPAHRGTRPEFSKILETVSYPIERTDYIAVRSVVDPQVYRLDDIADTDLYRSGDPRRVEMVDVEGIRSMLNVPLFSDGKGIGGIALYRREVDPFSDDDVALARNFAAQAVIAIENVRQFRELQTRLERERATGEVLEVISRSRDDEQPVFDVILEQFMKLCGTPQTFLYLLSSDKSRFDLVANKGKGAEEVRRLRQKNPALTSDRGTAFMQVYEQKATLHIEDIRETERYRRTLGDRREAADVTGARTTLLVPLLQRDACIGFLGALRSEVKPFSPDEIALLETFGAQAVIAIENVRQFKALEASNRDLTGALERQEATSDVLDVISQSPDDVQPVFDAIAATAQRLCGADKTVIWQVGADGFELAAAIPYAEDRRRMLTEHPATMDRGSVAGRALEAGGTIHVEDLQADPVLSELPLTQISGTRSMVAVPLYGPDRAATGMIMLSRDDVRPFEPEEIALVETFADQAAIAIENVRLFNELQTRLEREKATREILQVISRSRDDEGPVFDAILDSVSRLCAAPLVFLSMVDPDGRQLRIPAHRGAGERMAAVWDTMAEPVEDSGLVSAHAIRSRQVIHVPDLSDDAVFGMDDARRAELVELEGVRSYLVVPLQQGDRAVGTINLYRREVQPFTPEQIALVETFAAQAVIAIENVRQFRAIQRANAELQTRLEREAASREILGVISQSRDDEQPVFDVILENACRLCDTPVGAVVLGHEGGPPQKMVANRGASEAGQELYRTGQFAMDPESSFAARAIIEGRTIHIENMVETEGYRQGDSRFRTIADEGGVRTNLFVPLMSQGKGIGCFLLFRREVRPFTPDQIALIETFAAQAVIAIENVRQFRELQSRLKREAATREVLQVISRSRDDEGPVFDSILSKAATLCHAPMARLHLVDDDRSHFRVAAFWGEAPITMTEGESWPLDPEFTLSRTLIDGETLHLEDHAQSENYLRGDPVAVRIVEDEGIRTRLSVPLMKGDLPIGSITLSRREVKPFTPDQIALVETFAAQAVIAIENVRQFRALEDRTDEVQALNASLEDRVEAQVGEIERMGRLKSFLPAAVADAVVSSGSDTMLKSHRALLGILFCDIRGFTAFCETAEPEETIEVLQTYHQEMGRLIAEHGAGVDHRMGDGIMVLFNDPLPCDDPAGEAVRLAMAMREKMAELCKVWKKLGHRLGFGVGVSLGYATVGMVGYEGRSDYTASGTAVNLAARLCDQAEDGEILLSPRAFIAVEDEVECAPGGVLDLKGLVAPVEVMKALALREGF